MSGDQGSSAGDLKMPFHHLALWFNEFPGLTIPPGYSENQSANSTY